jgi:NADPH2:quinone reductase
LYEGDKVVIHSAAGGVGAALFQYAKHKRCEIFATTTSPGKVELLKQMGAHHIIDASKTGFDDYIAEVTNGEGVDVIFDAVGADYIRRGIKALAAGGRIVCYGAAQMSDSNNVFFQLSKAIQFGIYHPAVFMMSSKSLIGVNMLKIADGKPLVLNRCLNNVVRLVEEGIFKPQGGKIFKATEIVEAHKYLESKKSAGKVACTW